jgi:type II secretory pathway pseudopilin PulG
MAVGKQNGADGVSGFTLIELIMIILILSILSVAVVTKWPTGMDTEAAAREFKRAVRYAQHMAMTREFTTAASAWGITVAGNRYTIQRQTGKCAPPTDESEKNDPDKCAEEAFRNRALNDNGSISLSDGSIWFNGLGEPVGVLTYTIATTECTTISPQTGYIIGATCP